MSAEGLRGCPFCGGKAETQRIDRSMWPWFATCIDRECQGWNGGSHPTEAEAIAAWNRRATPTKERVAQAICCPSGCCWADDPAACGASDHRKRSTAAVLALLRGEG